MAVEESSVINLGLHLVDVSPEWGRKKERCQKHECLFSHIFAFSAGQKP
jgi:hypothetical protein